MILADTDTSLIGILAAMMAGLMAAVAFVARRLVTLPERAMRSFEMVTRARDEQVAQQFSQIIESCASGNREVLANLARLGRHLHDVKDYTIAIAIAVSRAKAATPEGEMAIIDAIKSASDRRRATEEPGE